MAQTYQREMMVGDTREASHNAKPSGVFPKAHSYDGGWGFVLPQKDGTFAIASAIDGGIVGSGDDAGIHIDGPEVASSHARIEVRADGVYLEDLFVEPDARGRGYGRALLARLAVIAMERNCSRVEWAVLDWNEPSIGFYKSIGAVPMDEWTVFRLEGDALETLATRASGEPAAG